MVDPDERRFHRQFEKLQATLPEPIRRRLGRVRHPSARWARIPAGVLLIVGGILGFLPVLGFWMIPLGALLLAQDTPFLRRPAGRALLWMQNRWRRWKRGSKAAAPHDPPKRQPQ